MNLLNTMSGGNKVQPHAPDLVNLAGVGGILGSLGYSNDAVYLF
jgi:hypothetical protein